MPDPPRSDAYLSLRGRREANREPERSDRRSTGPPQRESESSPLPAGGRSRTNRSRNPRERDNKPSSSSRYFDRAADSNQDNSNGNSSSNTPKQPEQRNIPRGPAALRSPAGDIPAKRPADHALPSGPAKRAAKTSDVRTYDDGRSYRPSQQKRDRDPVRQDRDGRDSNKDRNRDRRDSFRDQRDQRDNRNHGRQGQGQGQGQNNNRKDPRPKTSFVKVSRESTVYERVSQVGEGTYGKVYKARNIVTNSFVALKRLRMETEKEGFPITAMREIRLLQSLEHRHVVSLFEIMVENRHVYMVFEYADHDLTGILANPDVKFTPAICKDIFKQLLEGMSYLHSRRIIHRDIKGSNLLVDRNGVLKVADFGLARMMKTSNSRDYTNRVITLWYRPPELLLGTTDYGREVDMWGIGCLLVELFTKAALFQAQDELQQLNIIFEIMGTPTHEQWPGIYELPWYELVKPRKFFKPQFAAIHSDILSKECLDLSQKLLAYSPKERLTAKESLRHPYFQESPKAEPLTADSLSGEWHEFDAKKKRRKEREEKKQEELKRAQKDESKSAGRSLSAEDKVNIESVKESVDGERNDSYAEKMDELVDADVGSIQKNENGSPEKEVSEAPQKDADKEDKIEPLDKNDDDKEGNVKSLEEEDKSA